MFKEHLERGPCADTQTGVQDVVKPLVAMPAVASVQAVVKPPLAKPDVASVNAALHAQHAKPVVASVKAEAVTATASTAAAPAPMPECTWDFERRVAVYKHDGNQFETNDAFAKDPSKGNGSAVLARFADGTVCRVKMIWWSLLDKPSETKAVAAPVFRKIPKAKPAEVIVEINS
jgi:hypothetical protein